MKDGEEMTMDFRLTSFLPEKRQKTLVKLTASAVGTCRLLSLWYHDTRMPQGEREREKRE